MSIRASLKLVVLFPSGAIIVALAIHLDSKG